MLIDFIQYSKISTPQSYYSILIPPSNHFLLSFTPNLLKVSSYQKLRSNHPSTIRGENSDIYLCRFHCQYNIFMSNSDSADNLYRRTGQIFEIITKAEPSSPLDA